MLLGLKGTLSEAELGWIRQRAQEGLLAKARRGEYLSWYPAAFAVLLGNRDTFRRAAGAYVLAFMACVAGYLTLPVAIARPSITHAGALSMVMLRALYAFDPPVNVFPSFHAAVAAILWRLRPASRFGSAAVSAWTVALCVACVLTRQHYVLDVVTGLVVGALAVTSVDAARSWFAQTAKADSLRRPPAGVGDRRVARARAGRSDRRLSHAGNADGRRYTGGTLQDGFLLDFPRVPRAVCQ